MTTSTFPIRFDAWYRALSSALLLLPSRSFLEIVGDQVSVRMGWAFVAHFPLSSVTAVKRLDSAPISRGVHGFAGRWLVNGAGDRVLSIDLAAGQRARVLGFPVDLKQLLVSVDDPAAVAEQLSRQR